MTTYEHGRAPADAPVTWRRTDDVDGVGWTLRPGYDPSDPMSHCVCASINELESICRAFHLAALADEAVELVGEAMELDGTVAMDNGDSTQTDPRFSDWLRRHRAAKGER